MPPHTSGPFAFERRWFQRRKLAADGLRFDRRTGLDRRTDDDRRRAERRRGSDRRKGDRRR